MSFWSVDLSKWGDVIRRWFPLARELARHGATIAGPCQIEIDYISLPLVNDDDVVSIPLSLCVSVRSRELAELVSLNPVRVLGNLSAKLPMLRWPAVSLRGEAIRLDWTELSRPLVNVPALDPRVASVTIRPDGTGSIEIQRGPDGTITY